MVNLLLMKR